jgi:hypothetical protein
MHQTSCKKSIGLGNLPSQIGYLLQVVSKEPIKQHDELDTLHVYEDCLFLDYSWTRALKDFAACPDSRSL